MVCRKANASSADVNTAVGASVLDNIGLHYGESVKKELVEVKVESEDLGVSVHGWFSGANYGAKVAVHDLNFLLGDEVERLKQESEDFVGQELLILKNYRSESMRSLFLLLWRLQGYLAEPQIELIEPRQY